ncbi:uncharacterized protein A1O9_02696 [Exophiala aquamarina CBS 119918]|uniref:RRM domain-containing protein n=1 Tax=Exophiala aquamarina CBS 119918 TaxID=1182545 RepID=A0A072PMM4_9EURO|nr:uncharacterized protein A1O9_02696 [Exophiala aquamarina CBS 119918]KEF61131.1 hypothetical protein A1O9_02696 [Exophiala aquamarina CBS 119918]
MNAIRATQALNKRELENATPTSASWHVDYRDTAYIYVGGLHLDLTEGDVAIIFSQFGNPTHLNLIRDKETGKSKGFAFVKYEDQRSCDLAVDNLGGAEVLGRVLRVDHTRYKKRDDEDEETWRLERLEKEQERVEGGPEKGSDSGGGSSEEGRGSGDGERGTKRRRIRREQERVPLKEELQLQEMLAITQEGEEEDPMREYLIKEKREEVERAKERERRKTEKHREYKHKHEHHHRRRGKDGGDDSEEGAGVGGERSRTHRHRDRNRNRHNGDNRKEDGDGQTAEEHGRWRKDRDDHPDRRKDTRDQRARYYDDDSRERTSSRPHRSRRDGDFD